MDQALREMEEMRAELQALSRKELQSLAKQGTHSHSQPPCYCMCKEPANFSQVLRCLSVSH